MFGGKVVWITGGGSGIGLACALEFAKRGATVVVSGRRQNRLDEAVGIIEAAGGTADAVACDVTDEAAVQRAVATIEERHGKLDVALANAGWGVNGRVAELTDDEWRRQFDVNVFGLANTIRHAIPALEKTDGRIALVGSGAAFVYPPKSGAYSATKAAVHAIGETLSLELQVQGSKVTCTTIHPGFVESEIAQVDNAGVYDPDRKDRRPAQLMWTAEDAARVMVDAIAKRKRIYVVTGHGKVAVWLGRFVPGLVRMVMARA
jgi:NAD(P)-dependent dehydrogenase (short-subunit alcohol dehydrogenase family)